MGDHFSLPRAYVVMGVSGCGKSTVGQALADELGARFFDADHFHAPESIAKMGRGEALTDVDRQPWLVALAKLLQRELEVGHTAVLACSALKRSYRDQLRVSPQVQFIYLYGHFELIWARMQARQNHYMKADLLQSQFATLEPPTTAEALHVSINQSVTAMVAQIRQNSAP
jgi:carbohydrate kinase (thermoresistant glucokinase family)